MKNIRLLKTKDDLNKVSILPKNSLIYYQGDTTPLGPTEIFEEKTYNIICTEQYYNGFKWAFNKWGYGYSSTLENPDDITLVPVNVNGFINYKIKVKSNNGFNNGWITVDESDQCKLCIIQEESKASLFVIANNILFYISETDYPTCKDVTLRTDSSGIFISVKMYDSERSEYTWEFNKIK